MRVRSEHAASGGCRGAVHIAGISLALKAKRMGAEISMGSALGFERKPKSTRKAGAAQGPQDLHFTPRELALLRELVAGQGGDSDKLIAARLGIAEGTVKVYMHRLHMKLNLSSRVALALYVERSGMFRETTEDRQAPTDGGAPQAENQPAL